MNDPNGSGGSDSDDDHRDRLLVPGSRKNEHKRQRGWDGQDMEMEHQRQVLRDQQRQKEIRGGDGGDDGDGNARIISKSAAVDISQFQNFEVGKGYKAKHVVRQPGMLQPAASATQAGATRPSAAVATSSNNKSQQGAGSKTTRDDNDDSDDDDDKRKKKKHKKKKKSKRSSSKEEEPSSSTTSSSSLLESYLQCHGLREFRKEIEKILTT